MDKRSLIPSVILALAVMVMFSAAAFSSDWFQHEDEEGNFYDHNATPPKPQEFAPGENGLSEQSINYMLFENFGPILLVLALLMFGSIIGGVYIAREDDTTEEEDKE